MEDMKKVGKTGGYALLYFEVVSSIALVVGLTIVNFVNPGGGMNIDPASLDTKAVAAFTKPGQMQSTQEFLMNIIPNTVIDAFAKGEYLAGAAVRGLVRLCAAPVRRARNADIRCHRENLRTSCSRSSVALCKYPLRLLSVRPAPTARAGPKGLHSQPVLHNAHRLFSRDWTVAVQALAGWLPVSLADRGRDVVGRPADGLGDGAVRVAQGGRDLVPALPVEHRRSVGGCHAHVLPAEVDERDRAGIGRRSGGASYLLMSACWAAVGFFRAG